MIHNKNPFKLQDFSKFRNKMDINTPLLEGTKKEIDILKKTFSPEELAFLVYSGFYINCFKTVAEKINSALDILGANKNFTNTIMEVYFKIDNEFRLMDIYGIALNQKKDYIGRTIGLKSNVASVLGSKNFKEDLHPEKDISIIRGKLVKEYNIKNSIYFPISKFGVLVINKSADKPFAKKEKLFILNFIRMNLEPSLDLAIENEVNIDRAIKDSMTQLYNHIYFKMRLKEEFASFERNVIKAISLIMIDIDYFKHYNDTNGHPAGDVVIKKIAEILKNNTRKNDIVARYGGEEFVVLMPNAILADAINKAEVLRKTVEDTKFENGNKQPGGLVSISVGVANIPWHSSKPDQLLEFADKALYYSKRNGKNKVSEFDEKKMLEK